MTGVEKLDWCASIGNTNLIKNPFVRNMFKESKNRLPNFLRKCPFFGPASMINVTQDKNVLKLLPVGFYNVRSKIYDDQKVKQLKMEANIKFSMEPE